MTMLSTKQLLGIEKPIPEPKVERQTRHKKGTRDNEAKFLAEDGVTFEDLYKYTSHLTASNRTGLSLETPADQAYRYSTITSKTGRRLADGITSQTTRYTECLYNNLTVLCLETEYSSLIDCEETDTEDSANLVAETNKGLAGEDQDEMTEEDVTRRLRSDDKDDAASSTEKNLPVSTQQTWRER